MHVNEQKQRDEEREKTQKIINNQYSLSADLATGWRPKMKIIGPMPLNFDNRPIDQMLTSLISSETSMFSVIYLGIRPLNTFTMHEHLAKKYKYKYQYLLNADYSYLKPYFKKFYAQFQPQTKRPFYGMNPRYKENLQFDSCFESGNLDCVVKVRNNQYDLILRVDSNTQGHIMWYYFKVKNTLLQPLEARKVRFNIINFRKNKNFYQQTFKPYIKRRGEWSQGGENVRFRDQKISYDRSLISLSQPGEDQESPTYRKLSFTVEFDPLEELQFAYSIPYLYSQLLDDIKNFKKLAQTSQNLSFKVDLKHQSLSGLQIPHITIQKQCQDESEERKKYCILVIGRQHPGQANGSYVLKGIIEGLLKNQNKQIQEVLEKTVFHFVPMLNPDGVVMGNFRTSLYGKDLNRLFSKTNTLMIPEIEFCRNLTEGLYRKHKKGRLLMFLDIHGHSVRRNSFCYGPGILNANSYEDIREFPKIISRVTQIFRYPSCSFRISNQKKSTARAIFSRIAGLCYTIETSNWSYILGSKGKLCEFSAEKWQTLGSSISDAILIFIDNIIERKKRHRLKKQNEKLKKDASLSKRYKEPSQNTKKIYLKTLVTQKQTTKSKDTGNFRLKINSEKNKMTKFFHKQKIQENQQEQNEIDFIRKSQRAQIFHDSDLNEDDSDGSEEEDMNPKKFKNYINGASQMFIEFEKAYYGDEYEQKKNFSMPKPPPKKKKEEKLIQPCFKNNINLNEGITPNIKKQKKIIVPRTMLQNSVQLSELKRQKRQFKDPKVQVLSSLPRISVINYLAHEELEEKKVSGTIESSKLVFKVPKIESFNQKKK